MSAGEIQQSLNENIETESEFEIDNETMWKVERLILMSW